MLRPQARTLVPIYDAGLNYAAKQMVYAPADFISAAVDDPIGVGKGLAVQAALCSTALCGVYLADQQLKEYQRLFDEQGGWFAAGAITFDVAGLLAGGAASTAKSGSTLAIRTTVKQAPSALTQQRRRLALQNLTDSGDTVLGRYPGYVDKANSRGASYFDIGDDWDRLVAEGIDPWDLNVDFLNTVARARRPCPSVGAES